MGLFENSSPEQKMQEREQQAAIASENRQYGFAREQEAIKNMDVDTNYEATQQLRSEFLRWQQDLEPELAQLAHDLRNEYLTDDGWTKKYEVYRDEKGQPIKVYLPALMNELGIQMVITYCRPLVSKNLINTQYTDEIIRVTLLETMKTISNDLADNFDKYEADFLDYDRILTLIKNTVKPTAYRALGGWTKKTDASVIKIQEVFTEQKNQQKPNKKLFGFL